MKYETNFDLSQRWKNKMLSLPETGMGYQNVKVTMKDGTVINGIVYNSTRLKVDKPIKSYNIADISLR